MTLAIDKVDRHDTSNTVHRAHLTKNEVLAIERRRINYQTVVTRQSTLIKR